MNLNELGMLMQQREEELVASGFIEKKIDPTSASNNPWNTFYYLVQRNIELCKDPQYRELYNADKRAIESRVALASAQNLHRLRPGYLLANE